MEVSLVKTKLGEKLPNKYFWLAATGVILGAVIGLSAMIFVIVKVVKKK